MIVQVFVGLGIFYFNPEYRVYAGLSGAIHGYLFIGLIANKYHPAWVNISLSMGLIGKVLYEHTPHYQANELQTLLPVPVAYDAHLYGIISAVLLLVAYYGVNILQARA